MDETCPNCNRTFLTGRLVFHLKVCSPNKPMKKLASNKQPKQGNSKTKTALTEPESPGLA